VAFSGALSLLLLLLCMELLLQFGARISTSQVHSRILASYFCNIVCFFCNQRVFVCACVFFPPLSRVFGVYREIVGFGRVSLLLNL
jgi:hypothetical protein